MKYKLVKEYPGSPKLGTILTHEELQYYNWNEYYQEVFEKDYEILSLIEDKLIYNCDKYSKDYINQLFNTIGVNIHSVKRKDGEIFTIGDRLDEKCFRKLSRHPLSEGIHDNIITKIAIVKKHASEVAGHLEIQNGKLMFSASNKWNNLNVLLSEAIKYKQPLFTTEDGVDIFENNTSIYHVDKSLNIKFIKHKDFKVISKNVKYFSTKEKAEEYILLNKPVLSLKDLMKFFPDTYIPFKKGESATEDINTKSLEKLVQQKLNK